MSYLSDLKYYVDITENRISECEARIKEGKNTAYWKKELKTQQGYLRDLRHDSHEEYIRVKRRSYKNSRALCDTNIVSPNLSYHTSSWAGGIGCTKLG